MQNYNQSLHKDNRRRKAKIFLSVTLGLLVFGISGLIYLIYFTNVFRFNEIVLSGNSELTLSDLFPESVKPYLLQSISIDNPLVSNFTVKKNLLQKKLNIIIEERKPYGIWCGSVGSQDDLVEVKKDSEQIVASTTSSTVVSINQYSVASFNDLENECFWFDNAGLIFERAPATSGILIKNLYDSGGRKLKTGDYILPKDMLEKTFKIFEVLDRVKINTLSFDLPNLKFQEIRAVLPSKTIIYFSLRINPDSVFDALQSLKLRINELEYIDLRSENKVFYK